MNILYLISYAGKAGTEKYVENLMRTYSAQGHRCFLAYMDGGELAEKAKALGCGVFRLDLRASHALAAAKSIARLCAENGIDVIHAQYPRENVIAVLSRLWRRETRVVFTSHLTVRQSFLWRAVNRRITPHVAACIAVCTQGANLLRENGVKEEKIRVIFNGVAPKPLPPRRNVIRTEFSLPEDCFVFLTMARYAPEKGLFFLLDSLAELKKLTDRPFRCVICGDGEQFDAVKQKAAELGLGDIVVQTGYRNDANRILRASDLYLNTSSCNEAMSFAILEAMNCALPLVVTDVGGNRDLAETNIRCGFVVKYGDAAGFAGAIHRLMEDEALYRQFSADALRKISEEFDLEKLAWNVYRAYQ